jgi:hypothetical protein
MASGWSEHFLGFFIYLGYSHGISAFRKFAVLYIDKGFVKVYVYGKLP